MAFSVRVLFSSIYLLCFCLLCRSAPVEQIRGVLGALKGGGGGDTSSWDTSGSHPCSWKGVLCNNNNSSSSSDGDGDGDVTELSLSGYGLHGFISADISLLAQTLSSLDLSNNSLSGTIPPSLSDCLALSYLNLSTNKLSGAIPASLGKIKGLRILDLSQNELIGSIPDGIINSLTSLEILALDSNRLNGSIPSDLSALTALMQLSLAKNSISGPIPDMSRLSSLQIFSAYQNSLSGPIPEMGLPNLRSVNLASNQLVDEIPKNLCVSKQLKVLVLSNNGLTGRIPEELGSCSTLQSLRLSWNSLDGSIPESFGQLENLVYFEANHNGLTGEIPLNISSWKNLSLLNLAHNSLKGNIPSQLGLASSLEELLLSGNRFSGSIPIEIMQCKNLNVLDLSVNGLNGPLPDTLCSLPKLTNLQLESNFFSGSIPSSIGSCGELLELQLGDNELEGNIPASIGNLVNLQVSLNLSLNRLSGNIPDTLGRLSKLVSLDLSDNLLSGEIPPSLVGMSSLLDWNFSHNLLFGPVPSMGPLSNGSLSSFADNAGLCNAPFPPCSELPGGSQGKAKHYAFTFWKAAGVAIACAAVALIIIAGIAAILVRNRHSSSTVDASPSPTVTRIFSEELERSIDFKSIKEATAGNSNVISRNHFSTIYKASMPSGLLLSVKKLHSPEKGLVIHQRKLVLELDKAWKLSHENIMQAVGYYLENDLAIVIYDFVPSCSLGQKLHWNFEKFLSWSNRYHIAIGVAQGLAFLHHSCNPPLLHMDVSSSNIFLGPHSEVKIGDCEVTKLLDPSKHTGSVSAVAGSFGYIAPEYAFTMRVTLASNIYSFGVVLLELLTGRRPIEESFGDGLDLVKWVNGASARGEMPEQVLDARISGQSFASRQEMLAVLKLAVLCTDASPLKRPRMRKVLEILQGAKVPSQAHSPILS